MSPCRSCALPKVDMFFLKRLLSIEKSLKHYFEIYEKLNKMTNESVDYALKGKTHWRFCEFRVYIEEDLERFVYIRVNLLKSLFIDGTYFCNHFNSVSKILSLEFFDLLNIFASICSVWASTLWTGGGCCIYAGQKNKKKTNKKTKKQKKRRYFKNIVYYCKD